MNRYEIDLYTRGSAKYIVEAENEDAAEELACNHLFGESLPDDVVIEAVYLDVGQITDADIYLLKENVNGS